MPQRFEVPSSEKGTGKNRFSSSSRSRNSPRKERGEPPSPSWMNHHCCFSSCELGARGGGLLVPGRSDRERGNSSSCPSPRHNGAFSSPLFPRDLARRRLSTTYNGQHAAAAAAAAATFALFFPNRREKIGCRLAGWMVRRARNLKREKTKGEKTNVYVLFLQSQKQTFERVHFLCRRDARTDN